MTNLLKGCQLILLALLAAGCAIGPAIVDIAVTSAQSEPWQDLTWLQPGMTMRGEVYERLGEPSSVRRDRSLAVYGEAQLTGAQAQSYKFHFLFMEFAADDVLIRFELSRDHLASCAWDNICVAAGFESEEIDWGGLFSVDQFLADRNFVLTAPDAEDAAAKAFDWPTERCAVYVYNVETGRKPASTLLVHVNRGGGLPAQPLETSTYLYWLTKPGDQTIQVNFSTPHWYGEPRPEAENRQTFNFACAAGTAIFIRAELKTNWFNRHRLRLSIANPENGREAIVERRKAMNTWVSE